MMRRLSVRARLWLALAALAAAVLTLGAISWVTLGQATGRLDRLHDETLASVDAALALSREASALATRAPWLLTLESPYRIRQEGEAAQALLAGIAARLPPGAEDLAAHLRSMTTAIEDLTAATTARAGLTDQILRLNGQLAVSERRFATLSGTLRTTLPERQDWLTLQRLTAALLGAGRAGNLVSVGEFQREVHALTRRLEMSNGETGRSDLARLLGLAYGPDGLFELRRLELSRQIEAEAALARIRRGAEAVSLYAAEVTARAQDHIATERARTISAIAYAKGGIVAVGLTSTLVALLAAGFVSGHVTANLRAIADAMRRLAVGDRSSRLPRGTHGGDEIGTLFHAFRAFRANALRLDRSNRQLAQRNALFLNLYNGMSDGLAILSDQGTLIARNDRLAAVLRLDAAALDHRPDMASLLDAAGWLREAAGPDGFAELRHPDGAVIELRQSQLATGGSVMLLSDASERRQLQDRLRQIQRTEALGKVAGEVAHDFGNILTTISANLHLLETAPPERASALRHTIGGALDLGSALTQRLLAFARRLHLEPEVMDLVALVEGMEDLIALALEDRIALVITPCPAPLRVRIDPGQMESAVLNLCLNAAQAMTGAGEIRIALRRQGDLAEIEVTDTGCGMTPEVLAQAMEPFFTARADGSGTGLGLAMVYGFIRQSGGDVAITSAPGRGTSVRLSLPLVDTAPPALPDLGRVLLVEDNPPDAAHLRQMLTASTVIEVSGAEDALPLLAQTPDLVVTDLHLGLAPDGWRIAEAALQQGLRVVVLSGHLPATIPISHPDRQRLLCLPKPLTPALLMAWLQGNDPE